jgi:drug/metabolite transporter (DMT)-like permease
MRLVGIVLIVIGLVGVIWGGISWTQRESVANIGPLEITTEDRETLPIPPIVGAVCLIAGAIVLAGSRQR